MHDAPELEARARGLREVVPARLAQRDVIPPPITHPGLRCLFAGGHKAIVKLAL